MKGGRIKCKCAQKFESNRKLFKRRGVEVRKVKSNVGLFYLSCVGNLVVRASDFRPKGLGGLENISLPFSSMPKLWRWKSVMSPSIVPSGNFAELIHTVTRMVLKANDRRTSSPLPQ
ncbi:hypothetical protein TNCV_3416711 [Trichonephila clavipes]|nr:hypothetical protein TNCV_3416711 [Trichonephila clavipes]